MFSWWFFIAYMALGLFSFYQKLHLRNFGGSSKAFNAALVASSSFASIAGIGLLTYYAIKISWWPPLLMFVASLIVVGLAGAILEKMFNATSISIAGFVGWPACAYFMYSSIS